MIRYKWSAEKIARWHEQVMPDVTVAEQRLKLSLEAKEFVAAKGLEEGVEELADCYIAATALYWRFGDDLGLLVRKLIECVEHIPFGWIQDAVDKKMEINAKRVFVKVGDEYRHQEGN